LVKGEQPNDKFWQSVHLSGDQSAQAQIAAAEAEKKAWHGKVVVDTLDMKVGGFNQKEKPSQLDRTEDILKGEPKDLSLKKLREMKSASGKDLSVNSALFSLDVVIIVLITLILFELQYKTTPLTIMNTDEYVPNALEKSLLRGEDKTKFITTQETGTAADFTRYMHHATGKPKQTVVLAKKKHPPIQDHEKTGAKWERHK
jgi:hypothetical protein